MLLAVEILNGGLSKTGIRGGGQNVLNARRGGLARKLLLEDLEFWPPNWRLSRESLQKEVNFRGPWKFKIFAPLWFSEIWQVLVNSCPRLPPILVILWRKLLLERGPKGPQKWTIVDDCAQIAESSGLKPPFESPHLDFPDESCCGNSGDSWPAILGIVRFAILCR